MAPRVFNRAPFICLSFCTFLSLVPCVHVKGSSSGDIHSKHPEWVAMEEGTARSPLPVLLLTVPKAAWSWVSLLLPHEYICTLPIYFPCSNNALPPGSHSASWGLFWKHLAADQTFWSSRRRFTQKSPFCFSLWFERSAFRDSEVHHVSGWNS